MARTKSNPKRLEQILSTLSPREQYALRMRFGLGDDKQLTLAEVNRVFNITRAQIKQLEKKALKRCKVAEAEAFEAELKAFAKSNPGILEQILGTLSPREQYVLRMRYGLGDGKKHTLAEANRMLDITRAKVRAIEQKALKRMRHPQRLKALIGAPLGPRRSATETFKKIDETSRD